MLESTQALAYIAALGVAAAIPGPGMTALVARCVSSGASAGFAMLAGLILGDLTYLSFAVFGLAVLAKSFSVLFVLVKWGAVIYLCILPGCFGILTTSHWTYLIAQSAMDSLPLVYLVLLLRLAILKP